MKRILYKYTEGLIEGVGVDCALTLGADGIIHFFGENRSFYKLDTEETKKLYFALKNFYDGDDLAKGLI